MSEKRFDRREGHQVVIGRDSHGQSQVRTYEQKGEVFDSKGKHLGAVEGTTKHFAMNLKGK